MVKKVTYTNIVCEYYQLKDEPYRVRLTVGGDKLDYIGETSSPAANLFETKLLINSVISDAHKGARFLGIDIEDFSYYHHYRLIRKNTCEYS